MWDRGGRGGGKGKKPIQIQNTLSGMACSEGMPVREAVRFKFAEGKGRLAGGLAWWTSLRNLTLIVQSWT